jgi:hypothetical protein
VEVWPDGAKYEGYLFLLIFKKDNILMGKSMEKEKLNLLMGQNIKVASKRMIYMAMDYM